MLIKKGRTRIVFAVILTACLSLVIPFVGIRAIAQAYGVACSYAHASSGALLPDPRCTPGSVFTGATMQEICTPGYTRRVRNVSSATKRAIYAEYGIYHHTAGSYEIDHLVPLEVAGSNSRQNLWPQPATPPYGFHAKDGLEDYLHEQVCRGQESLPKAQYEIAHNWYTTWVKDGRPMPSDFGYSNS